MTTTKINVENKLHTTDKYELKAQVKLHTLTFNENLLKEE